MKPSDPTDSPNRSGDRSPSILPVGAGHLILISLPKIIVAIGREGLRSVDIVRTWLWISVNRGQVWRWGGRDSFIKKLGVAWFLVDIISRQRSNNPVPKILNILIFPPRTKVIKECL